MNSTLFSTPLALLQDIGDRPVLIAGPTASGKSSLALEIADRSGGVVVNADALQVFDRWRVLTARPTPAEESRVAHRLYGHIGPEQPYSVGHWLREVAQELKTGKRPIIVGGTGLYFRALTEGLAEIPPIAPEIRAEADLQVRDLAAMGRDLDEPTRRRIDLNNPARVQRAWEVLRATGRGLAEWQADTGAPLMPLSQVTALVLRPARDWLWERIDARFEAMIAAGALDEVRGNLAIWNDAAPWAKAIGAPELVAHIRGEVSLPEAIERAKIASRQYAKRQTTWFRARMKDWRTFDGRSLNAHSLG